MTPPPPLKYESDKGYKARFTCICNEVSFIKISDTKFTCLCSMQYQISGNGLIFVKPFKIRPHVKHSPF